MYRTAMFIAMPFSTDRTLQDYAQPSLGTMQKPWSMLMLHPALTTATIFCLASQISYSTGSNCSKSTSHTTPVLIQLHWLPGVYRIQFKILILSYKALYNQSPTYFTDLQENYTPLSMIFLSRSTQDTKREPQHPGRKGVLLHCPKALEFTSHIRQFESNVDFKGIKNPSLSASIFTVTWLLMSALVNIKFDITVILIFIFVKCFLGVIKGTF